MSTSASDAIAQVEGRYFDGRSSRARPARLAALPPENLCILVEGDGPDATTTELQLPLREIRLSQRLGSIPRRLTLPDGSIFETAANDALDRVLALLGQRTDRLHWLEAHRSTALAALALTVAFSWAFLRFGLPALADRVAERIPAEVDQQLGEGALKSMDQTLLRPSRLPPSRRHELQRRFDDMTADLDPEHAYWLELRSSPALGPNAVALPSRIVVLTDELVAISEHDDELVAVLAHELGHIANRHALRHVLRSAGVSALAVAILGDISSMTALAGFVPALVDARYSREFESDADAFAKRWLRTHGIPASRFDDILCRLEQRHGGSGDAGPLKYLASHPSTEERARCGPTAPRRP